MKLTWKFCNFDRNFAAFPLVQYFCLMWRFSQLRGVSYLVERSQLYMISFASSLSRCSLSLFCLSLLVLIFFPRLYFSCSRSLSLSLLFSFSSLVSLLQSSYQQLSTLTNNSSVSKQLSLGSWKLRMLSGYVCRVMAVLQKAATRN